MSTLYKSSTFQTYAYFVIYPLLICICVYCIFGIVSYGDYGAFNIIMILVFLFGLVAATECLLTLRYIEVTNDYILIKTLKKDKVVKFKDVAYVYNLISYRGTYLVLWYKDPETLGLKVILVRPEMEMSLSRFNIYSNVDSEGNLGITKFIKEKAKQENPGYLKTNTRRWFLFTIKPDLFDNPS